MKALSRLSTSFAFSLVLTANSLAADVRITVHDEQGQPVQGAHVGVSRSAMPDVHGVAADGSVVFTDDEVASALISAWAEGFATATRSLGADPEGDFVLVLAPEATITSSASMADGSLVPAGVRVAAVEIRSMHSASRDVMRYVGLPRGFSAPVDVDGHFEIKGLRDGVPYALRAFGAGVHSVPTRENSFALAPGLDVHLTLRYVTGVRIDREASTVGLDPFLDALVEAPQRGSYSTSLSQRVTLEGDDPMSLSDWSLRLAGLAAPMQPHCGLLPDRAFFSSASAGPSDAAVTVMWNVPFAEPVVAEGRAAHATSLDALPVITLPSPALSSDVLPDGWSGDVMGAVHVTIEAPWLDDPSMQERLDARLVLRPRDASSVDSFSLSMTWSASGALVAEAVPPGTYDAWLNEPQTDLFLPPRRSDGWALTVEAGGTTSIDLSHESFSAVDFIVVDSQQERYAGSLAMDLTRGPHGAGGSWACLSPRTPHFLSDRYAFPLIHASTLMPQERLSAHPHNVFLPRGIGWTPPSIPLVPGEVSRVIMETAPWPLLHRSGSVLAR
ncbi:MAG: carboxypeptidase-like regulatory domain-containing protein [Planctomycetota bacterium]